VDTSLGIVAATWGVVMAMSPILQIRKIVRLRSSRDVSIGYLTVLVVGFALWIAYGLSIHNAALVIPNIVALLMGLATIGVSLSYGSRRHRQRPRRIAEGAEGSRRP
jgi:MtN3 and saliva related transmembrane protein